MYDVGVLISFGVEMYCNEISVFMVFFEIKVIDGICMLLVFLFMNFIICVARFASVMNVKVILLIMFFLSLKIVIVIVSIWFCVVLF